MGRRLQIRNPPSQYPTESPFARSLSPTESPFARSLSPTESPFAPSLSPTESPFAPSLSPTESPFAPSLFPTESPTISSAPSTFPTQSTDESEFFLLTPIGYVTMGLVGCFFVALGLMYYYYFYKKSKSYRTQMELDKEFDWNNSSTRGFLPAEKNTLTTNLLADDRLPSTIPNTSRDLVSPPPLRRAVQNPKEGIVRRGGEEKRQDKRRRSSSGKDASKSTEKANALADTESSASATREDSDNVRIDSVDPADTLASKLFSNVDAYSDPRVSQSKGGSNLTPQRDSNSNNSSASTIDRHQGRYNSNPSSRSRGQRDDQVEDALSFLDRDSF